MEKKEKKYVLYQHILPNNETFYVGIGNEKRPYSKSGRSDWWRKTVAKYEYTVDILVTDLTWDQACDLEIHFVRKYGRRNKGLGPLINLTDGGEGAHGLIMSPEAKLKLSQHRLGKFTGEDNPFYGRHHSEETIKHLRESQLGEKSWKFGKSESGETRKKKSISQSRGKGSNAKKVIDIESGKTWDCLKDAAEELGYNYTTAKGWMSNTNPRKNKSKLRYLNNE